jgi:predicted TIM-barrel fold metal-dependent hydrolase
MLQLAERGVRGFRIQPAGRPADAWLQGAGMQEMWRCGGDEGLALCHLINPRHLPSVDDMCRRFPATTVVIDHLARIGSDGVIRPQDVANLCRLARHGRVFVKASAFYALGKKQPPYLDLAPFIRQVFDAFGPDRLMWASDCPFQVAQGQTYRDSIDLIAGGLDFLSDDDRQRLLRTTAERIFFP